MLCPHSLGPRWADKTPAKRERWGSITSTEDVSQVKTKQGHILHGGGALKPFWGAIWGPEGLFWAEKLVLVALASGVTVGFGSKKRLDFERFLATRAVFSRADIGWPTKFKSWRERASRRTTVIYEEEKIGASKIRNDAVLSLFGGNSFPSQHVFLDFGRAAIFKKGWPHRCQ